MMNAASSDIAIESTLGIFHFSSLTHNGFSSMASIKANARESRCHSVKENISQQDESEKYHGTSEVKKGKISLS